MRRAALAAVAAAFVSAAPATAEPAVQPVNIIFQAFSPSQLDVLPGETVQWTNVSDRRHTVTADDGSFDSGDVFGGDTFSEKFDAQGAYAYHCRVHAGMVGEVDVRKVILGLLPPAAVPAGQQIDVDGRTADPLAPVTVERDTGSGFKPVGVATPKPDGTWQTTITAVTTGDYRASVGGDSSETRHLLVTDRHVNVRAGRRGISVTVVPADPYARIQLQLDLRERFGWWPEQTTRLDYVSEAHFALPRGTRARVVLVDTDGWTPVATSPIVRVKR
ncbi:MAG: plastocyanin/azurin family copper-binding protein [Thermoleophilaceae bacterium]